jgi:hypothetical protein
VRNGAGYPHKEDGQHRRAGMVNFRISLQGHGAPDAILDPCVEVVAVTREQLAQRVASCCSQEEAGNNPQALDSYMSVAARLLALLADEFGNVQRGPSALVVIAPQEEIRSNLRFDEPANTRGRSRGTVFSDRFPADVEGVGLSLKEPRILDRYGGPMDGAFLVSHLNGEVIGADVQIFGRRFGARRLSAAGVAATLSRGIALSRSEQGHVTVFLPAEVQRGGVALRLGSGTGNGSTGASSSAPGRPVATRSGPVSLGDMGRFKANVPMARPVPPMSPMMVAAAPASPLQVRSARERGLPARCPEGGSRTGGHGTNTSV